MAWPLDKKEREEEGVACGVALKHMGTRGNAVLTVSPALALVVDIQIRAFITKKETKKEGCCVRQTLYPCRGTAAFCGVLERELQNVSVSDHEFSH